MIKRALIILILALKLIPIQQKNDVIYAQVGEEDPSWYLTQLDCWMDPPENEFDWNQVWDFIDQVNEIIDQEGFESWATEWIDEWSQGPNSNDEAWEEFYNITDGQGDLEDWLTYLDALDAMNNPPPPPNDCTLQSIVLASIPQTVKPGDDVNLSVTFTPAGSISNVRYDFEAFYTANMWETLWDANELSSSFIYPMKVMGTIKFRVKINYICNNIPYTAYSNEVTTSSKFCATDFSTKYATEMNNAWTSTLQATTSGSGMYEYGFYGIFDRGIFSTQDFNNSATCAALVNQSISTYTIPAGANPNIGTKWWVGKFHTHPPLTNCTSSYSRNPGPSSIDLQSSSSFPCLVRDYTTFVQGGHNPNLPTMDYAYDVTCTTYHP